MIRYSVGYVPYGDEFTGPDNYDGWIWAQDRTPIPYINVMGKPDFRFEDAEQFLMIPCEGAAEELAVMLNERAALYDAMSVLLDAGEGEIDPAFSKAEKLIAEIDARDVAAEQALNKEG